MEEVYVVKVRSKPCASRLFPSERRYSASTVGGLGAIHLLLSLTCLLLGGLHLLALPGPVPGYGACLGLGAAATLAGLAGVIAWRRWYLDNNIRWFFISSCVSGLTALLCMAMTAATLAETQESLNRLHLAIPTQLGVLLSPVLEPANTSATQLQTFEHSAELVDIQATTSIEVEDALTRGDTDLLNDTAGWLLLHGEQQGPEVSRDEVRSVVAINIIVASTLELVWSLLSAKIAWRGMMNLYPDDGENSPDSRDKRKEEEAMKQKKEEKKEVLENKPDIICNHKRRAAPKMDSGRRDSNVSHEPMPKHAQDDGPCLPPMERTMDFQEKIHRFLESNREHCLNMNVRDM